MKKRYATSASIAAILMLFIQSSQAQYVWLNEKGAKQYSDQPPPKTVPRDRIIKAPGSQTRMIEAAATTESASNTNSTKSEIDKLQKPATLASKNEDFNKRKIAKEEAEKKAEAEKQANQDKEKNCARARAYQQSIEGGMVIATRDQNGERVILDETQRARELADAKKITSECK